MDRPFWWLDIVSDLWREPHETVSMSSLRHALRGRGLPRKSEIPHPVLSDAQIGDVAGAVAVEDHEAELRRAECVRVYRRELQRRIGTAFRHERVTLDRDGQRCFRFVACVAADQVFQLVGCWIRPLDAFVRGDGPERVGDAGAAIDDLKFVAAARNQLRG